VISLADIETERLTLRLLPVAALEATAVGDYTTVSRIVGCTISDDWSDVVDLAKMRLEQLATDAAYLPWSIRAVVLRSTNEAVGYANFHAAPAPHQQFPAADNMAELGYTIFAPYRRQGFARETLAALLQFARSNGADQAVVSIAPDNEPSLRLAAAFDFTKIGSQMDEIDGPEDVFLLKLEA
jgi:[ribosomal protein S5]-alanine N-acetyltransferase